MANESTVDEDTEQKHSNHTNAGYVRVCACGYHSCTFVTHLCSQIKYMYFLLLQAAVSIGQAELSLRSSVSSCDNTS